MGLGGAAAATGLAALRLALAVALRAIGGIFLCLAGRDVGRSIVALAATISAAVAVAATVPTGVPVAPAVAGGVPVLDLVSLVPAECLPLSPGSST